MRLFHLCVISLLPLTALAEADKKTLERGIAPFATKNLPRGTSVYERNREENKPEPIRLGTLVVRPGVNAGVEYNDNVFFTSSDTDSDTLTNLGAGVTVGSDWSRHSLLLRAGLDRRMYQDFDRQNASDVLLGVNGALDLGVNFNLNGGLNYQQLHQNQGSPNNQVTNGEIATEYKATQANIALVRDVGLVGFDIGGGRVHYDYDDNLTFNNDDRDRDDTNVYGKVSYRLKDTYKVYTKLEYLTREYDTATDDNGFKRDSDGYIATAGLDFDLTKLITGDVYVGYSDRDYDDARFKSVGAGVWGTSLLWSVTPISSLRANIERSTQDSISPGIPAYVLSQYSLRYEHEVMRSLLVAGDLVIEDNSFINSGRQDSVYLVGASARYYVTRYASLDLGMAHNLRDSNTPGQDYRQNSVFLGASLRY
jgi:hypothetical protein